MDERSWAEKPETGQNALAHLGSAPEQNCTGALGKCAHAILHWRTWQVRPGLEENLLVGLFLRRTHI